MTTETEQAALHPAAGLLLLTALTAIGPVSFQIFLPSLPAIKEGFGAEIGVAQLAVSLSMFGIAAATLVYGRLADVFGRRPTLIAGMAILLAGSLICAAAPNVVVLIVGRIVQAAGGAAGMVVTRAIVLDLYGREHSREIMAKLMTAMVAAPMVATPAGGLINDFLGWRVNFLAIALCASIMLAAVIIRLPETRSDAKIATNPFASFGRLLGSATFSGNALQVGFGMAAFMAFTTGGQYYLIDHLGLSATEFGFYTIVVTIGFMGGGLLAGGSAERMSLDKMVLAGSALACLASFAALGLAFAGLWTTWALILPAAFLGAAIGLSMPNAQAGAVAAAPDAAGTASGLAGFIGTILGAVTAQAVGMLQNGTPYPITGAMALAAILSLGAACLALDRGPTKPAASI